MVPEDRIHAVLADAATPDQVVSELIGAANEGGGPDNIACAAADIVPAAGLPGDAGRRASRAGGPRAGRAGRPPVRLEVRWTAASALDWEGC